MAASWSPFAFVTADEMLQAVGVGLCERDGKPERKEGRGSRGCPRTHGTSGQRVFLGWRGEEQSIGNIIALLWRLLCQQRR